MTRFAETDAGERFIESGKSRETSLEIMEAIAFFARNETEAEALWNGDGLGRICHLSDLWEHVTGNGRREADEFCWGAAGTRWFKELSADVAE